jgi:hypothetical protein
MHAQETTLTRLLEERRRQDEIFRSLCATLASLDAEQRFQLSEAFERELEAAWEFGITPGPAATSWYSLRA